MLKRFSLSTCLIGILLASVVLSVLILRFFPLNYAVYQNLLPLVRIQAFLGADLNSRWVFDETPLMTAATESRAAIFQFLLEAGANINVRTTSFYGETVLHRAARDGCETCVNLLIEKNIDINQADSVGRTALFFALFQEKTATKLLEAGADPNISAESGTTPLIVATNHKNVPIIKLLLRHGASPEKTGPQGNAIDVAERNGDIEIVFLLKQHSEGQ